MTVLFQASDEPISSRLEHWRQVVDETFGPALLPPPSRTHVPQQLVAGDVGAVRVSELRIAHPTPSADRCQAARYRQFPGYGFWAAVEKASGQFLGWFHLRPPEGASPDEPELDYRLRRSAWGKGYAPEGSRALVRMAFTELGARRVYAETMAVNRGSRRVMEKAGLRLVRSFRRPWPDRIEGDEHGDVEYALTRAEWEELTGEG